MGGREGEGAEGDRAGEAGEMIERKRDGDRGRGTMGVAALPGGRR